ncbi:uncharacterized protein EDB93DRAFT_1248261 [Suillus bovinus]|uniref:uncharacterized protein n=1 Tax=Suillus bovinus TaxID=48563 RepID=UPI001B8858C5|nr:uncharacterized protein EDB93DRAFT_1248261 [Suillus bovinus]KAG2154466.1 hypothetical protein EDB93DRAFT_1248261 [Suillus bovinus]
MTVLNISKLGFYVLLLSVALAQVPVVCVAESLNSLGSDVSDDFNKEPANPSIWPL